MMSQNSRRFSEAVVYADISALSPAERMELSTAISSRLGDQVVSQGPELMLVRTDNRARVSKFVRGFGASVEGVDLGTAMIEAGVPAGDVVRYLVELPSRELGGVDPRDECPEGTYWDKAIAECRPAVGDE